MSKYERVALEDIVGKYGITGIHPAAELLPLMSDEEFEAICDDVALLGFLESVKINDQKQLIDGRNRIQVAWAVSKDPRIERFNPPDVLAYVLSENIHRRHLTAGQRAMIAERLANLTVGNPQFSEFGELEPVTQAQAAEKLGTRSQAISEVREVREWAPEEAVKVQAGTQTLNGARKVARRRKKDAAERETPAKVTRGPKKIMLSGIIEKNLIEVPYPQPKGKHTFNQTNEAVDWASWTWNPVTGCLHGCRYCYAREMAYRDSYAASYPIQFAPLFHHERLDDPINTTPGTERPQDGRVFVCSMADLFGEWVPREWIDAVFDATLKAPEWEYLFLTKFPQRYRRINLPPKAWFGASVDIQKRVKVTEKVMPELDAAVRWASIEPMLEPIVFNDLSWCDLLVIGAQSETYQPEPIGYVSAFAPPIEWVIDLIAQARHFGVPVYMKPNLLGELSGSKPGMKLIQEQPRKR